MRDFLRLSSYNVSTGKKSWTEPLSCQQHCLNELWHFRWKYASLKLNLFLYLLVAYFRSCFIIKSSILCRISVHSDQPDFARKFREKLQAYWLCVMLSEKNIDAKLSKKLFRLKIEFLLIQASTCNNDTIERNTSAFLTPDSFENLNGMICKIVLQTSMSIELQCLVWTPIGRGNDVNYWQLNLYKMSDFRSALISKHHFKNSCH